MNTITELLDALRAHLGKFELPALWSVTVTASHEPDLSAQLACEEAPKIATGLLAWADTLAEPRAEAWRTPHGDRVHLSVTGHLPGRAHLLVYGAVPFPERGPGADLAPGDRTPLLLGTLRHLAALGEVSA